jgi:hypothetical protein
VPIIGELDAGVLEGRALPAAHYIVLIVLISLKAGRATGTQGGAIFPTHSAPLRALLRSMAFSQHRAKHVCSRTHSAWRHNKLSKSPWLLYDRNLDRVLGRGRDALPVGHRRLVRALLLAFHSADFDSFRPFSFLLVRLVTPLSFKDVLHLSLYPSVQEISQVLPLRWWQQRLSQRWLRPD